MLSIPRVVNDLDIYINKDNIQDLENDKIKYIYIQKFINNEINKIDISIIDNNYLIDSINQYIEYYMRYNENAQRYKKLIENMTNKKDNYIYRGRYNTLMYKRNEINSIIMRLKIELKNNGLNPWEI
jgi:hypothetical protein